jgi:hypothetical protein
MNHVNGPVYKKKLTLMTASLLQFSKAPAIPTVSFADLCSVSVKK